MIRGSSSLSLVVLLVAIIAALHVGQAADTVPLANVSDSGEGDFSADTPSYSFTWSNNLANSSVWTRVSAGATAGFENTTVVGIQFQFTFQADPEGTPVEVSTVGFSLLADLSLPFVINIPPCSTYANATVGDKVGNWTVTLTFSNVSSIPEGYVVHSTIEIGAQATSLELPQTTYSQQVEGSFEFNTIEFAAFNASYSSLNAIVTISDLSQSTLEWLQAVQFTQGQCVWSDGPLSFALNTTNTTTTIALNSVQAGVWQVRLQSKETKDKPTVGISWEVTGYNPVKQDENKSWWTTEHIIYVSLAAAGGILLLVIVVGVVVWLVKRKGAYEEV